MGKTPPLGWIDATLGDLVSPSRARVLPGEGSELPYVGLEHVEPHTMRLLGQDVSGDQHSSLARFYKGDVLYAKMRPYLNKVLVATFDGCCSPEFLVFRNIEALDSEFLAYRLNSPDFVEFANQHISGDRPRVDFDKLSRFPIMLPPRPEQARIVAKLKALLAQVTDGEAAIRRALSQLNDYRSAVLHAAVTGDLSAKWRNLHPRADTGHDTLQSLLVQRRTRWIDAELKRLRNGRSGPVTVDWERYPEPYAPSTAGLPAIPHSWTWASADQLTDATRAITYGVIKLGPHVPRGVPVLRSSNVRRLELDLTDVKRVGRNIANSYARTYLAGGEVLVTVRGTLGGVAAVPTECAGYNISREVALLALLAPQSAQASAFFIASDLLQQWLLARTKGIAYTGINIQTLRQLPLPLPPMEEQSYIAQEVERRLGSAAALAATTQRQLAQAAATRRSLLLAAFRGQLVPQDTEEVGGVALLEQIKSSRSSQAAQEKSMRRKASTSFRRDLTSIEPTPSADALRAAWRKIGRKPDAQRLFAAAGFQPDHVLRFYEVLRSEPDIRSTFAKSHPIPRRESSRRPARSRVNELVKPGRFRLVSLWLENFKNLQDYTAQFGPGHGFDVVLGWNGTGKSNLFEALVIIFRDLHYWWEKNKWPAEPMAGYRLRYEIEDSVIDIKWDPSAMKRRPDVTKAPLTNAADYEPVFEPIKREALPLPRFVFGYYSGPTNRLAEHFWPMKRDHYERLRKADSDDPETLASLLQQRRFFCAEASHAKYVLLAFSYKEDSKIRDFLKDRLRIVGFESALFVIRKPRWARGKPADFWGATGIMRRVMEKLREHAIAPMVLKQRVADGYRSPSEELYYFFLPDLASLHAFAAEYADARSFFLALESTDFSDLIYDVRIQVRVRGANDGQSLVTFQELSEGEQQLLMVLGLMRFTKSHQSLVLLDEPDTHLNPQWSVQYLKDLVSVTSDDNDPSPEQVTSQLLMATHDPLAIASLVKEQVHLLKRDPTTSICYWERATINPKGLGFTGILTSELFGFRSDLDPETLADLDSRVRLLGIDRELSVDERNTLEAIDLRLADTGFTKAFSDPYYAAFVRAWGRRHAEQMANKETLSKAETAEVDRIAKEVLAEAIAEVNRGI